MIEFRSTSVCTYLVEQSQGICRTATLTGECLCLHQQHVGIAQQGHVVRLVTAILEVIVDDIPLHRTATLTIAIEIVANIECRIIFRCQRDIHEEF